MSARDGLGRKRFARFLFCASFLLAILLSPFRTAEARSLFRGREAQQREPTPSELINAVNALRSSHGLSALKIHRILMQTAQSQANALLASHGAVGHSRPGGMTYTEQLIQLGYPLAGDLSLGGFRSENYVFGTDLTIADAMQFWLGDEPHTNTMLSPNYLDIGAGVAIGSDGTVYYVVDTARPTSSGLPQSDAASALTVTVDPSQLLSQYIIPVSRSTARPDGMVYHKVQYGQSLWSIAIAYGTTIKNLQALNNLSDTTIFDGQVLLVQRGATQPASPVPTPTGTPSPTPVSATPTHIELPASPTMSLFGAETTEASQASRGSSAGPMLGIVVFLMVVGATAAALLLRQKN
jgi:uncharacterized protein YkwD